MTSESATPPPVPARAPAAPASSTSALAVASLIAGIFSWILMPFIAGVVAVICGHMARGEIKRSNGTLEGDGLAIAGLVLGYAMFALTIVGIAFLLLFFGGLAWLGFNA